MNATQKARLTVLEKTLSTRAGVPVEVTIRGERAFTFTMDGEQREAADKLVADVNSQGDSAEVHVFDIGEAGAPEFITCVYVETTRH